MKPKKISFLFIICLPFILTACGDKTDPEKVAAAFIDSTIYHRNNEEAEKYFYQLNGILEKDLADNFQTTFNLTDEQANELAAIYSDKLKTETSFSTELISEKKETKIIEITVIGLNQDSFEQILDEKTENYFLDFLQKKGFTSVTKIEAIDTITDLDSLKALTTIFENMTSEDYETIQYEALKEIFQELKANKKNNQKIQLVLERDKKEQKYWQIQNEETIFNQLFNAFQGTSIYLKEEFE